MSKLTSKTVSRRGFLSGLSAVGLTGAAVSVAGCSS